MEKINRKPHPVLMSPDQYYQHLVDTLEPEVKQLYDRTKNVHIEFAWVGRRFVVYQMDGHDPLKLDTLVVDQIDMNDETGTVVVLVSEASGRELTVSHRPVQIWQHPVLLAVPCQAQYRYTAAHDDPNRCVLSFPILVRPLSRYSLRERGVVHCETEVNYNREFVLANA